VRTTLPAALIAALVIASSPSGQTGISVHASQAAGSGVELTRIDAIITDRQGRPISDLTPADLELRDDGVVQTIEAVEFESAVREASKAGPRPNRSAPDEEPDEKEAAQRPDARLLALFLDEFHISPASTTRVREALERFVDEELRPDDLVVVMKPLDSLTAIQLTRDRAALGERIRTFEGRKGDYRPRTPFEETYMNRAPAAAEAQRAQVVLSALRALTIHLGELREGRKTLVFLSEGVVRAARRDGQRVPDVQSIARSANGFDVAIYSADPQPLAGRPVSDGPRSRTEVDPDETLGALTMLQALAEETGGEAVRSNDLIGGLRRAAQHLDGYYRLTYRPAHAIDGRRHAIDLQVKRPGAEVRVRTGHWAPLSEQPRRAAAGPSASASSGLPRRPQQISPFIRPWFGMSRGSNGSTRVTFTWEPNNRAKSAATALTLSAVAPDGTVLFQGRVDPIRASGTGSGSTAIAVFEAPPGLVQLDMTIQGVDGRMLGADARDINLPNLNGARTILSTPAVLRTRTAREFRAVSADFSAPPVASREFSRTERLLIRVHAYSSGDRLPTVTARLVSRVNQLLRELPALSADPRAGVFQFDVPLSSLAIGEYGIELTAQNEDDSRQAKELILFRVTN